MSNRTSPGETELYDLAPCGLLKLDRNFVVLSANAYFYNMVGVTDDSAPIKFQGLLSVAGRIFLQTRLQQELALSGRVEELALDLVRQDGERVPIMLNAVQEADRQGRPGAIHMALWRAAAKRAYEAEVPKARMAAEEAARVKADFLANISHEIRTPLNGVLGVAGVLARTELTARQREMVGMIQSSGGMLERIVSDILDLSKVQAGGLSLEAHPFDLQTEIGGVVEMTRLRADEKGLVFQLDAAPEVFGRYLGDAVRLKQVLGNLTSNAVKFTEQGEIRVTVTLGEAGELVFRVADTGIGFDEIVGDTLFRRFQQADAGITRKYGGTGLGLSISKSLVDLMGGTITARSKPGEGSTFEVRLPLPRVADEQPVTEAAHVGEADGPERLRILLVEDNPVNQRVVALILEQYGVELEVADNGALGLEAWRESDFDVVLMDMQMPVMDGLTAIQHMRELERTEQRRRTPIAVLSANAMEHHRQQAVQAGADVHIAKPVTPQTLVEGVERALSENSAA
ncbi:ATP-binding protein [Phenylobacterium deserti]|uniref:ATP-binding protein n=1 Tax=Phenylobacterium deserti TaxID=1914756 RepID=UPI0010583808|nr:ATP-binding protein [Phenylobacterium deserti]